MPAIVLGRTATASAPGDLKSTELILTQSAREGEEVRFAVNRQYLARATKHAWRQSNSHRPDGGSVECLPDVLLTVLF